jgi:hypothetical protein
MLAELEVAIRNHDSKESPSHALVLDSVHGRIRVNETIAFRNLTLAPSKTRPGSSLQLMELASTP